MGKNGVMTHPLLTKRNACFICFGYIGSWPVPPLNGSLATTYQLLDAWRMVFPLIWLPSYWESSIEPCSYLTLSPSNPMGGLFGSFKCRPTPTFLRLLLSFILPPSHGLTKKPGCMLVFLKVRESLPSLPASNFSASHRGGGYLKNSYLLR